MRPMREQETLGPRRGPRSTTSSWLGASRSRSTCVHGGGTFSGKLAAEQVCLADKASRIQRRRPFRPPPDFVILEFLKTGRPVRRLATRCRGGVVYSVTHASCG